MSFYFILQMIKFKCVIVKIRMFFIQFCHEGIQMQNTRSVHL